MMVLLPRGRVGSGEEMDPGEETELGLELGLKDLPCCDGDKKTDSQQDIEETELGVNYLLY